MCSSSADVGLLGEPKACVEAAKKNREARRNKIPVSVPDVMRRDGGEEASPIVDDDIMKGKAPCGGRM